MRLAVASMFILITFAGCLVDDEDPVVVAGAEDEAIREEATAFLIQGGDDHDHHDAAQHRGSRNVERVAYHNGVDNIPDPDRIPGDMYYTELAIGNGYVYLARASIVDPTQQLPLPGCGEVPASDPSRGGFSIINVQNPERPMFVGEYNTLSGADIEVSWDDKYVFFATQRNCLTEILGNLQLNRDPSDVPPRGIHIVDVSDPVSPALALFVPLPVNGPHTITYHERNGQEYLYVSTYDLYEDPGTGALKAVPLTQRVLIYQLLRDPSGGDNGLMAVPINTFFLTDSPSGQKAFFPHDAIPQEHPRTGQMLLYVAYWDKGLQLVDTTDPMGPLPVVDQFTEFSPSSHNAIHQVRAFDGPIAGKHVTVTEPEIVSAADETGYITFLDTSDPTDIRKLGQWTLPGDLGVQNFDFSPHNFDLWDGKVVLAHNHAGLWIIDAGSEQLLKEPKSVGYYVDVEPRFDAPRPQPWFWGAFEQDGLIYAADESSGLYILRYTGP